MCTPPGPSLHPGPPAPYPLADWAGVLQWTGDLGSHFPGETPLCPETPLSHGSLSPSVVCVVPGPSSHWAISFPPGRVPSGRGQHRARLRAHSGGGDFLPPPDQQGGLHRVHRGKEPAPAVGRWSETCRPPAGGEPVTSVLNLTIRYYATTGFSNSLVQFPN